VIHEQTFAGKNQLEVDVPFNSAHLNGNWTSGVGDITVGLKRELFSSERAGSILSLQGGVLLPTGDSNRGFRAGTTQFEPFAAYDQLITNRTFAQVHIGADLPVNTDQKKQTCQQCHMPEVREATPVTGLYGPEREGARRHVFVGANFVMAGMLDDHGRELAVEALPKECGCRTCAEIS
jgi:hypothetical protein